MKKCIFIFCLFISLASFAQEPIKYKAISYFYIERINGKKDFSKTVKVDNEILLDLEKNVIKNYDGKVHVFQIIKSEPTEFGSNFSISIYKCIDENKVECSLSLLKFSKPNQNGALQQFYISYQNIEHVYDINLAVME